MKSFYKFFSYSLLISLFALIGSCSTENPVVPPDPTSPEIGTLESSPDIIEQNTSTNVTFRFTLGSGISISDTLVRLSKADNSGNPSTQLGFLQDNGNLGNGDEIAGDGVFSGIFTLVESTTGASRYIAGANVTTGGVSVSGKSKIDTVTVFNLISSSNVTQVTSVLAAGQNTFVTALGGNVNNYTTAYNTTVAFLQTQPGVSSVVGPSGSTSIEVNFSSGLTGGLILATADASGTVNTRGGFINPNDITSVHRPSGSDSLRTKRNTKQTVPIERQTRGDNPLFVKSSSQIEQDNINLDPNTVGNRNVLIYAPYEAAFAPYNERTKIKENLNTSNCKAFTFTELVNQEATVKSILDMTKYGFVVLATHGVQGRWFLSGETFDTNATNYNTYRPMLSAGRLGIFNNIVISSTGGVNVSRNVYGMKSTFVSNLAGSFPNSIILNNSCEGTMNADLQNAFTGKGAKTYYGYTKVVNSDFAVIMADTLTKRLARGLNTGQSFFAATDPRAPNAVYQIKGSNDMSFSLSLSNGNFETGNLENWTKDGDGRVISRLGSINPTQGSSMGIISTGLGFTTASGSLIQCFIVTNTQSTISLKWNFLSEEFLEFIGSQFQDFFQVKIVTQSGAEVVVFRRTIDQIAAQFGATTMNQGTLIRMSPGIVFDQGDVYMTDWQTLSFDVTPYRNQVITIKLEAGDVGDSIYDTAILLDEVAIN